MNADINSFSQIIVALALGVISIAGGYAAKFLKSHKEIETLISVLDPVAKSAVVAMHKLGVDKYISGEDKKIGAVKKVYDQLRRFGLTPADETLIKNTVEKQYAELIKQLDDVYPQVTEAQQEANDAKAKAEELAKAQQALTDAQARVNELQK